MLGALVGAAFGAALPASLTGIGALGPITSGALFGAAAGGVNAVGAYVGQLSNEGERLVLRDASGT